MSVNDDLVTWLRSQLDDDEQMALAASEREWRPNGANSCEVYVRRATGSNRTIARCANGYDDDFANSLHIARHDPARVLAEVDAKRRILDHCAEMLRPDSAWGGPTDPDSIDPGAWYVLRLLALPYADRPGYRDDWRPNA